MFVNEISLRASSAPVKSVTIFQSWTAEVTRTLALELKSGKNVVKITGISSDADTESPRISGAPDGVRVLDVACLRKPHDAPELRDDIPFTQAEALLADVRALEAKRTIRAQELSVLNDMARAVASNPGTTVANWRAELLGFMDGFVQRQLAAQTAVEELDAKIKALQKKIWLLRNAHKGEASTTIVATIAAKSEGNVELKLTYLVSGVIWRPFYDLHATTADGQPSAKVSVRYCATISQSTGEDWTDTAVTLSTANSQAQWRLSVPSLSPLKISVSAPPPRIAPPPGLFGNPPPPAPAAPKFSLFGRPNDQAGQGRGGLFGNTNVPPPATAFGAAPPDTRAFGSGGGLFGSAPSTSTTQPTSSTFGSTSATASSAFGSTSVTVPTAFGGTFSTSDADAPAPSAAGLFGSSTSTSQTETPAPPPPPPVPSRNALSVSYRVEGAVSLPSDGEEHKLTITALDFKAALEYVCVPQQSQAAFIVGTVKNTSEYDLLPGPVSVFMDDSFVTKTSVEFIAVNESFPCVLGVDTSLKVAYRQSTKTEHEPKRNFAEPHKTVTRTATTTITNQHAHAVSALVVRDALPLGNDDVQVAVMLRKPAGLAEATQGSEVPVKLEDAEGVSARVRWTKVEDGKGGEKDGLYEWVCAIPAGKKITLEAQWDAKGPSNLQWHETPRLFGQ